VTRKGGHGRGGDSGFADTLPPLRPRHNDVRVVPGGLAIAPAGPPYRRSAAAYDGLYLPKKDYRREAVAIRRIVRDVASIERGDWLDVACGTGLHAMHLAPHFRVEGVDASEPMLKIARRRLPHAAFHVGDMRTFRLPRRFDVVSCLFSSIGYMRTRADLERAIANLARHLRPDGVLAVEPWFSPSEYLPGTVHLNAERGRSSRSMHQARMIVAARRGRVSVMDAHHLVGTPRGVEHFVERHEMGLFTRGEYAAAFRKAGLVPSYRSAGLEGRGLHLGRPGATRPPTRRGRG